jgi:hypothetical protein
LESIYQAALAYELASLDCMSLPGRVVQTVSSNRLPGLLINFKVVLIKTESSIVNRLID